MLDIKKLNKYIRKKLEDSTKKTYTVKFTTKELLVVFQSFTPEQKVRLLKQVDPKNYEDILFILEDKWLKNIEDWYKLN